MTGPVLAGRASAALLWLVAAVFGVPAVPCAHHLLRNGRLPSFFGQFRMYQRPVFCWVGPKTYALLLYLFTIVSLLQAGAGLLLWNGSRAGAILSVALLPAEIAFWLAFALPIPPVLAAVRPTPRSLPLGAQLVSSPVTVNLTSGDRHSRPWIGPARTAAAGREAGADRLSISEISVSVDTLTGVILAS